MKGRLINLMARVSLARWGHLMIWFCLLVFVWWLLAYPYAQHTPDWVIRIPFVFACLTFATALREFQFYLRSKRHKAGLCIKCGYDLRATPDRCPECGTAPIAERPI